MRTWLARLGFPFLVLAFVLAWEGHKQGESRAGLYYVGAVAALALGLAGIRERHRPPPDAGPPE